MRNGLTHRSTRLVHGPGQEGKGSLAVPPALRNSRPSPPPSAPIRGQGRQPRPAPSEAASSSSSLAGSWSRRSDRLSASQPRSGSSLRETTPPRRPRGGEPAAASRKDGGAAPLHAGSCSPPLRAPMASAPRDPPRLATHFSFSQAPTGASPPRRRRLRSPPAPPL